MARTVMEVMESTAKKWGSFPALKSKINGKWQTVTWEDYRAQSRLVAQAFMTLGLAAKDGVAIIGENCPQWFICDVAAIYAGGVPAGIYTTNSAEQCLYIAENSDASIAVVENEEQLAKFKEVEKDLPRLKAIVMMTGSNDADNVYSWEDLPALAEKTSEEDLEERINAQRPDDMCTLIYTSGTTGNPKGVMITHTNITWTAQTTTEILIGSTDDRVISYLPLSHIAEQVISLHAPMQMGASSWFAESLDQLGDNLREVRPTIFLGVPRVWEKIQAKMVVAGSQNPPLRKKIAAWARGKGLEGGYASQENRSLPFLYGLADKLVFSKVREKLGLDQCRLQISSAAPISLDTLEFFLSLGVPICEVYGMSECSGPATIALPDSYKTGKVGRALPGGEIKIAEDGEILMRGPHVFKGYLKNEAATAEALDEAGWLHSGDIGELDSHGYLKITDRKKDIIITAGGENIAPQLLEGKFKAIPIISQAVVIGDKRKYLTALFTLDPEKLETEVSNAGSPAHDSESAATCPQMMNYIQSQVDEINKTLSRVQAIKKFTIIPSDFSIEGGELTPTMKVKRKIVREKYQEQIESMY